jgi:hypothetical protein
MEEEILKLTANESQIYISSQDFSSEFSLKHKTHNYLFHIFMWMSNKQFKFTMYKQSSTPNVSPHPHSSASFPH